MNNGYVLLWRRSLNSAAWKDLKFWRLWSWCLLTASWQSRTALLGRDPVRLEPGSLAASLAQISAATGLSTKELRSCLALGKKLGCLESTGTPAGMLLNIVNWQEYQHPEQRRTRPAAGPQGAPDLPRDTPGAQLPARSGHALGQPSPRNKENREEREPQSAADCAAFLSAYPKKTGQDHARAAWSRLDAEHALPPLSALLAALDVQRATPAWTREGGRYIPSPANWLLRRSWETPAAPSRVRQWLEAAPNNTRKDPA